MKFERKTFKKVYGFIDYHYSINEEYPHGILIFLGSYIKKEFREKGLFKPLVSELFNMFPKGTEVHLAVCNLHLINFFKSFGFKETNEPVEFWGICENTINLKGFL